MNITVKYIKTEYIALFKKSTVYDYCLSNLINKDTGISVYLED